MDRLKLQRNRFALVMSCGFLSWLSNLNPNRTMCKLVVETCIFSCLFLFYFFFLIVFLTRVLFCFVSGCDTRSCLLCCSLGRRRGVKDCLDFSAYRQKALKHRCLQAKSGVLLKLRDVTTVGWMWTLQLGNTNSWYM